MCAKFVKGKKLNKCDVCGQEFSKDNPFQRNYTDFGMCRRRTCKDCYDKIYSHATDSVMSFVEERKKQGKKFNLNNVRDLSDKITSEIVEGKNNEKK